MATTDIPVYFSPHDLDRVYAFVDALLRVKTTSDRVIQMHSDEEWLGNERAGKLAEVAFAKHFGWRVDWSVHSGGDGHVDFRVGDGRTVDVKAIWVQSNFDFDFQLAVDERQVVADAYVQVLVDKEYSYAVITGWISREQFRAQAVLKTDWNRGADALVVPRSQLSADFPAVFWCVGDEWTL